MLTLAVLLLAAPVALLAYAYVGYPALLALIARARPRRRLVTEDPAEWPTLSITLPAYNEAASIEATLENLVAADYPADRREIVVVSDASTDGTDDIVRRFASRGVSLVRLESRSGKSAAENAAGHVVCGDLVVNTDASVRIQRDALRRLVRVFADPQVGVASGRDVSVGDLSKEANGGESGYVDYEMRIRSLETRVDGIVGASGCCYAFRREIYDLSFPADLSRDFAAALIAREKGFRAVSVDDALCLVPRTPSLNNEAVRKARTMARGLRTLWYKRRLLDPMRYGLFAWMLFSHKLCRWLVYPAFAGAVVGLALLAATSALGFGLAIVGAATIGTAALAMRLSVHRRMPRLLQLLGFVLAANLAGLRAWGTLLRGERMPVWEPTRRPA